jgi:hypothetical protein
MDHLLMAFEQACFWADGSWSTVFPDLRCVLEATEEVDGQTCWKISNTARTGECRLVAWVAPGKDFAPVRVNISWFPAGGGVLECQMRVIAHRLVGESWIASKTILAGRAGQTDLKYWHMSTMEVTDVEVGDQFAPVSLAGQLPPGTHVQDLVGRQSWDVGADGEIKNVQTPESDPMLRMVVPLTPAEIAAQKALGRRCAIISAVLLGIVTVGMILVIWKRWFRLLLTAACALVAVAWGVSIPYCITYEPGPDYFPGPTSVRMADGFSMTLVRRVGIGWGGIYAQEDQWGKTHAVGLHMGRRRGGRTQWWPQFLNGRKTSPPFVQISLPLWMPLAALAVPTALVWRRYFRRARPGHCRQCGYNLTGNVSGVCPECGTPRIPAAPERVGREQTDPAQQF